MDEWTKYHREIEIEGGSITLCEFGPLLTGMAEVMPLEFRSAPIHDAGSEQGSDAILAG
jgi:hypothetical protein